MIPENVDIGFLGEEEGFDPHAHRPGGKSGITIGRGLDLRYIDEDLAARALGPHLNAAELETVVQVLRMRLGGEDAQRWIDTPSLRRDNLLSIEITYEQSEEILAVAAEPYWEAISKRFPVLLDDKTPSGVKTAFLSLAYNRGPHNPDFERLRPWVEAGEWRGEWEMVAKSIASMPQIPARRKREAELVRNEDHARFLRFFRGFRWFQSSEIRRAGGKDVPPEPWDPALPALRLLNATRAATGSPIALQSVLVPGAEGIIWFKTGDPAKTAWTAACIACHSGDGFNLHESGHKLGLEHIEEAG